MSSIPSGKESFEDFYTEVKEIEKRDSVLTPKQQIERLLRPGSTYFNLNPFEVLQVDPEASLDEIKRKYRRLSILVHPDKNIDDSERAQQAFEIINRAWKTLECEDTRKKCLDIYQEAKERTEHMIEQKRKKQKKENRTSEGIPEDDPDKYKHAVYVMTMKLFADMERKRQHLETRDMEERKRKREAEIEQEEQVSLEKEWAKNFEESRQNRVDSWKTFQSGGSKEKKKKKIMGFKPPKPKPETFCQPHMNELPVPCGPWDPWYRKKQSFYMKHFALGLAWWLFSFFLAIYTDSIYLNWGPPRFPGPPSDMVEECDDSDS